MIAAMPYKMYREIKVENMYGQYFWVSSELLIDSCC